MRLIPSAKSAGDADTRIIVGSVVEYEQHGTPLLGVVTAEKRGKWGVLNTKGASLDLAAERLFLLPGRLPDDARDTNARIAWLERLDADVADLAASLDLEEIWNLVSGEKSELNSKELTELAFSENSLRNHAAMRRALLMDTVFFKRAKSTFSVRPPELVEELKGKREEELRAARERAELRDALVKRILAGSADAAPVPDNVQLLEEFAAFGKSAPGSKEALSLLEEIEQRTRLSAGGAAPERAFQVLVKAKHFSADEDLNFLRLGRPRRFLKNVHDEIERLFRETDVFLDSREDLRGLDIFTIDGPNTQDRDDALSLERGQDGSYRVGIHISDITPWMNAAVLLEHQARTRATSIYTPDYNIPMLPESVSEDAFSLLPGVDRLALSFFVTFDADLRPIDRRIVRSVLQVRTHMVYPKADAVLFGEKPGAPYEAELAKIWEISLALERARLDRGALQFNQREMYAKLHQDGRITLEEALEDTPAHKLIGEMMILANETAALYAREANVPMVFRSQDAPDCILEDQGNDIPEGPARDFFRRSLLKRSAVSPKPNPHSGLGLQAYLQITSPIRRYIDLVNERQLASHLERGQPHYSASALEEIIENVRNGLDEAVLIQRERNRYWLLKYLEQQGKPELRGLIIKTDGPKPLAELDELFLLVPFHPAGPKDQEQLRSRRGSTVDLMIERLEPRKDMIVLREKES